MVDVPRDIEELDEQEVGDPSAPLETVQATAIHGHEIPLLAVLSEGVMQKQELMDRLGERLEGELLPGDRRHLPAGHVVWRYRASWALTVLKKNGEIRNPALATWEITEAGRQRLAEEQERWDIR